MIIDLYFLIAAVIARVFISMAELAIPTVTPINEANAEIETQPMTAELKLRNYFFLILNSNQAE